MQDVEDFDQINEGNNEERREKNISMEAHNIQIKLCT
jgi:hypothetical protein